MTTATGPIKGNVDGAVTSQKLRNIPSSDDMNSIGATEITQDKKKKTLKKLFNDDPQLAALKKTRLDFVDTLSKGINNNETNATDSNAFNLNILIGNTDTHIVNHNFRNNGSFNKKI